MCLRERRNRYWIKRVDELVVLLPLVRKLLIVGRPKYSDITNRINEETFGSKSPVQRRAGPAILDMCVRGYMKPHGTAERTEGSVRP
jgi:hypothetical protein